MKRVLRCTICPNRHPIVGWVAAEPRRALETGLTLGGTVRASATNADPDLTETSTARTRR